MRRMRLGTVVVVLGAGMALAGVRVGAQYNAETGRARHRGCSEATIEGTYGIQITGTRPSEPGGPMESVIGVIIRHYDGRGQFTQVDNVKGSISGLVPDREGSGTYQVNRNCSGVAQAEPGPGILLEERFVIVDDGSEIRSMTSLPPPVMVTGVYRRINAR
jgi:hypothetical protein